MRWWWTQAWAAPSCRRWSCCWPWWWSSSPCSASSLRSSLSCEFFFFLLASTISDPFLSRLCHLYKRRSSRKMMGWGREHCCHQPDCAPSKAPVFTLATSSREGNYHQEEPVYQEIKETSSAAKQKTLEEPSWAPKPTIVYGVITAKERAKYIPPIGLVRPEPTWSWDQANVSTVIKKSLQMIEADLGDSWHLRDLWSQVGETKEQRSVRAIDRSRLVFKPQTPQNQISLLMLMLNLK